MTASLLVMVPTRGRRKQVERLLESYDKTTDFAEMTFITDPDDESYDDIDWKDCVHGVLDPRGSLTEKLNETAMTVAGDYDALMYIGDDHVFETNGWDTILMDTLKDMGGTGMVYPDDRKRSDIPEICCISSDIVKGLGHFAEPSLKHYYIDNAWFEIGARSSLLRYVPEAVIPHLHYQVAAETERDETYSYAENTWGRSDYEAYQLWRATTMSAQVSYVRRTFNPDVKWVFTRF